MLSKKIISILYIGLITFSLNIKAETKIVEYNPNQNNVIQKLPNQKVLTFSDNKLISIIENVEKLTDDIDSLLKEFKQISNVKLKNAFICGLLKFFKGTISIKELRNLSSLENKITPEGLLEITTRFIANKNKDNELKVKISEIENKIKKQFTINLNIPNKNNILESIKQHPTIKKIIEVTQKDPNKLKDFLNYIVEESVSTSSKFKGYIQGIIRELDKLFNF